MKWFDSLSFVYVPLAVFRMNWYWMNSFSFSAKNVRLHSSFVSNLGHLMIFFLIICLGDVHRPCLRNNRTELYTVTNDQYFMWFLLCRRQNLQGHALLVPLFIWNYSRSYVDIASGYRGPDGLASDWRHFPKDCSTLEDCRTCLRHICSWWQNRSELWRNPSSCQPRCKIQRYLGPLESESLLDTPFSQLFDVTQNV